MFPLTKEHIYNLCWSFSLLGVCLSFLCEGTANFFLCFFLVGMGWVGIGWGLKHPRRIFVFSLVWSGVWWGGGEWGEGVFLGSMVWGTGKFRLFYCKFRKTWQKFGNFHQTLKSPKLARIKNIILKLQIETNITRNWK